MSKEKRQQSDRGPLVHGILGETCDLGIVDELAAPDMLLQTRCMRRAAATTTSRRS